MGERNETSHLGTGSSPEGFVLVVEDDPTICASIENAVRPSLEPVSAITINAARELLPTLRGFRAAVVDVGLPDGSGLDFVEALRAEYPTMPILVLTGHAEPNLINRAHVLGAEYVCKPQFHSNLKDFLRRAVQPVADDERRLSELAQRFAGDHSLSVRETQILGLAMSGVPRGHLAEVLGVSENTIKTQVRSILDKTQHNSLSDVVWQIRQEAFAANS